MLQRDHLAASVICLEPDLTILQGLLRVLSGTCSTVLVIDNGGLAPHAGMLRSLSPNIRVIAPGANIGMAAALNLSFRLAQAEGHSHLISFDQDSTPAHATIDTLVASFNALAADGKPVAAVGPSFYDPRKGGMPAMPALALETRKQPYLITSGCLASVSAWLASGGFDEKLFIDLVDVEWCWRLASLGLGVFTAASAMMEHRLSEGITARLGRYRLNSYRPIRRYYIARNSCHLLFSRARSFSQRRFLLKTFIYSLVCAAISDRQRLHSLKAVLTGCLHAAAGRMGKHDAEMNR